MASYACSRCGTPFVLPGQCFSAKCAKRLEQEKREREVDDGWDDADTTVVWGIPDLSVFKDVKQWW